MNSEELINKMMEYYDVHTISELSKILDIGQPAISKWKINNSINTIKKKCRELGIYNQIFGDIDTSFTQHGDGNRQISAQNNTISNTSVNSGGSVIDNSNQKNITVGSNEAASNNIPAYLIDDLNNLFLRASENNRIKEVIEAFDDFIYTQKKNLRD
ncbi:hypothetical protein [Sulfurimonas sp.]|uniref:hypothetical protein n=1 Tax=Sulfurimonas sp. TaxID=2022749 RepID=UPI003D0D4CBA